MGDVADVIGLETTARVRKINLKPSWGQSKYVPRSYVECRIRDVVAAACPFGPARIKVSRAAQRLKGEDTVHCVQRPRPSCSMTPIVALIKVPRIPDLTVPYGAKARVKFEDGEDFVGLVRAELIIEQ